MKSGHQPHPPCWVIAPSLLPPEDSLFGQLSASEETLLARGTKIRIVVFDLPEPVWGVAVFNASQKQPTTEQLERIYHQACECKVLNKMPIGDQA
jgi:hypothetical protein